MAIGGSTLQAADRVGPAREFAGDTISMWCYAEDELSQATSPLIGVQDARRNALSEVRLLGGGRRLPAKKWTRLNFPIAEFEGRYQDTDEKRFDPSRLSRVTFTQGLDDGQTHVLYLDDVRLVSGNANDTQSPTAPTGLAVEGQDSHFDLSWKPNGAADLCSYRIYRSEDGQTFAPVGTREGRFQRAVDFVAEPGKTCLYKISAVDLNNNESPLSESAKGTTRALDDDALLDMVQQGCFRYYWEVANRESGMALEVVPGDENLIAVGGSGFGIMALVAGTERNFITRGESVERMLKIVRFLERADRFHGAFPHYLDGRTGRVWPLFGKYDNGGDLVETAFLMQGLLTARQYFDGDSAEEREIRDTITALWNDVEWDWYRKTPDGERLYWHWSPDHGFHINHPLVGWNETMIVYLLAIASPTHSVPASLYYTGWAGQSDVAVDYRQGWSRTTQGDHYTNGNTYYGHKLDVGCGTGGDLFFAQFSFLGFDPRGIKDRFTNYFDNNRQLTLINRAYCVDNPRQFAGYGPDCWGLSAGINNGGGKPQPRSDNGTICCSAALGCFPYTPDESMRRAAALLSRLGRQDLGPLWFSRRVQSDPELVRRGLHGTESGPDRRRHRKPAHGADLGAVHEESGDCPDAQSGGLYSGRRRQRSTERANHRSRTPELSRRKTWTRVRYRSSPSAIAYATGVVAAVGDANVHPLDAGAFLHFAGAAVQMAERRALAVADDLDVAPADAAAPAGAERFEHRLFRGPAAGVVLRRRLAAAAVLDLGGGEDPRDENVLVPLDHVGDPRAFHDVGTDAEDGHGRSECQRSEVGGRRLLASSASTIGFEFEPRRTKTTLTAPATMSAASMHHSVIASGRRLRVASTPRASMARRGGTAPPAGWSRGHPAIVGGNRGKAKYVRPKRRRTAKNAAPTTSRCAPPTPVAAANFETRYPRAIPAASGRVPAVQTSELKLAAMTPTRPPPRCRQEEQTRRLGDRETRRLGRHTVLLVSPSPCLLVCQLEWSSTAPGRAPGPGRRSDRPRSRCRRRGGSCCRGCRTWPALPA